MHHFPNAYNIFEQKLSASYFYPKITSHVITSEKSCRKQGGRQRDSYAHTDLTISCFNVSGSKIVTIQIQYYCPKMTKECTAFCRG